MTEPVGFDRLLESVLENSTGSIDIGTFVAAIGGIVAVGGMLIGYGKLMQKTDDVQGHLKKMDKQFENLNSRVSDAREDLASVKSTVEGLTLTTSDTQRHVLDISASLARVEGKIDVQAKQSQPRADAAQGGQ